MGIFLSVLIPCYNEQENLRRDVLKQVYEHLKKKKFSWEVIVSDDGSTDDSVKVAEAKIKTLRGFRLLKNPHGGKPSTLNFAIKAAKGEYVLFTDMDQSTPIAELGKLLPHVKKHEVVIGSRGRNRKDFPLYRQLGAIVFATFRKSMLLRNINDTQCGFKLFKKSIVAKAFPNLQSFKVKQRVEGWKVTSYDVELLHIISKMGHEIKEVVVKWQDEDTSTSKGEGLSRYIRESNEMVGQILRVKLNDLRGEYKVGK